MFPTKQLTSRLVEGVALEPRKGTEKNIDVCTAIILLLLVFLPSALNYIRVTYIEGTYEHVRARICVTYCRSFTGLIEGTNY